MEKQYLAVFLAFLLSMRSSYAYFMDFNRFAGDSSTSSGTVIKREGYGQRPYYFDSTSTSSTTRRNLQGNPFRYQYYFGLGENYLFYLPTPTGTWTDPTFRTMANSQAQMQGVKNMYKLIGIPIQVVQGFYVPYLRQMLDRIDHDFSSEARSSAVEMQFLNTLYNNLQSIKQQTDYIVNTYLRDVKTIIVGSNNRASGQKLFISTDNMEVNANNSFIYNGNASERKVTGKNIMRTKKYEINFDQLESIKRGQIVRCMRVIG